LNDTIHRFSLLFLLLILLIYFLILGVSFLQIKQAPDQIYALALVFACRLANPYLVFCRSKIHTIKNVQLAGSPNNINVKKNRIRTNENKMAQEQQKMRHHQCLQ